MTKNNDIIEKGRERDYWLSRRGKDTTVSREYDGKIFYYKGIVTEVFKDKIELNVQGLFIPVSYEELIYFIPASKWEQFQEEEECEE